MGLFAGNGAHVLVDGQFGSTGKGLFASYLAWEAKKRGVFFKGVISNAGPNSGHTFYHDKDKHVLKQLPTFAVKMALMGRPIPAYLSAGAVIDPEILRKEAEKYPSVPIFVHNNAAVINGDDAANERSGTIAAVAGTRSGTGMAQVRKVLRDPTAVFGMYLDSFPKNVRGYDYDPAMFNFQADRYFLEVSQGFSLGINSQFYPKVTSRECTVMQAISDARIAPKWVNKTYMVIRTFPIRVGNFEGHSSGDCYPDQKEITWEELGVEPELTTVTRRVRRVFTFSEQQLREAVAANAPDIILVNFMNYLGSDQAKVAEFVDMVGRNALEAKLMFGWNQYDEGIVPWQGAST